MKYIEAPNDLGTFSHKETVIFLGGSIEMGKAENWQTKFVNRYENCDNLVLLNPRRKDWDSSWSQDPTPGTKFHEQVTWELKAQELSDIVVYYFDPNTTSPITLLELGLFSRNATGNNAVPLVCCSPEYFRYGNIKIVCDRYHVPIVHHMEHLYSLVDNRIKM